MRLTVCVLTIVTMCLAVSCRRNEQPAASQQTSTATTTAPTPQDLSNAAVNTVFPVGQPQLLTQSKLGTKLDREGNVSEDMISFKRTDPIYLSMWLKDSPAGLQTSARWYDSSGIEVAEEFRPMNGAKVVTFKLDVRRPKAGTYRAVGYWGGNIAAEYEFTITK